MQTSLLSLSRPAKQFIVIIIDIALCILSVWVAFYLRLGHFVPLKGATLLPLLGSIILAIPILIISGLYHSIFRHSGFPVFVLVGRAILVYGLVFAGLFTFISVEGVPRTVGLIQPMILMLLIGGSRATARLWLGSGKQKQNAKSKFSRSLIYGAGEAGRQLASAVADSPEIKVLGFLDDDKRLHGKSLNGIPIYNPDNLNKLLLDLSITDVLLALPGAPQIRRNEIIERVKSYKILVRTLPGLSDLATGKIRLSDVRELDINELLGRESVTANEALLRCNIFNKTVLVTGSGGSIGSELCRQIIKLRPAKILLVEMCEFALYQIDRELRSILRSQTGVVVKQCQRRDGVNEVESTAFCDELPLVDIVPLLVSVCDGERINKIIETWRPDTVYHAAAYKHVPIVEHNPVEGLRNNIWGTRVCAEAAQRWNVKDFVLISTDKAVRPTNIMGATKRLSEMVLQALAEINQAVELGDRREAKVKTKFSMVRFGNVLGSSGSVVPMFRDQIKSGGPITVTHTDITRYFMTIPEAAQLVIQAGAMAQGGDVFVLDMGKPVKIIDLARRVVEMSGMTVRDNLNPDGDIEILVTGLRPGEKLYEELLISDNPQPTQHPRIMRAREGYLTWVDLEQKLDALRAAMVENEILVIHSILKDIVTGYHPDGKVVDWLYTARLKQ